MTDETDMLLNVYHEAVEEVRHRRNLLMYGIYIGLATGGIVVSLILKIIYDSNFAPDLPFFFLPLFIIFIAGIVVLIGARFGYKSQNAAKKIATDIAIEIEKDFIKDAEKEKEKLMLINKIEGRKDDKKERFISKNIEDMPLFGLILWIIILGVPFLIIVFRRIGV